MAPVLASSVTRDGNTSGGSGNGSRDDGGDISSASRPIKCLAPLAGVTAVGACMLDALTRPGSWKLTYPGDFALGSWGKCGVLLSSEVDDCGVMLRGVKL